MNTVNSIRLIRLGLLAGLLMISETCRADTAGSAFAPVKDNRAKPNIILVVLDDVGYSDLGCYGSEIRTPNIDSLARNGLRYLTFDTNAVCSATRASLLTGRNSQTVKMGHLASMDAGFLRLAGRLSRGNPQLTAATAELKEVWPGWRNPKDQSPDRGWMPRNAETVAQALKRDGYATWAIGKWHLAPKFEDGSKGNNLDFPLQRGFEYFYGYRDGWTDQYRPILYRGNRRIPIPRYPYGKMLTWDLVNHAIGRMKAVATARSHRPFFLYLALPETHAPIQVTQPYINAYDGVYDKGWDAIRGERFRRERAMGVIPRHAVLAPRPPGVPRWNTLTARQKRVFARYMQTYAGYLQYGDQQLGRLLDYMRHTGIIRHTLIVLVSDNGPAGSSRRGNFYTPYADRTTVAQMAAHLNELGGPETEPLYQRGWAMAGATPYRRYKLWPYLGGVRDDLIVSWAGHIQDPGSVRDQYVHAIDIAPTLLAAAGTRFENTIHGVKQIPVAGESFLRSFTDPHARSRRTVQYFLLLGNRAITSGHWRAVAVHRQGAPFSKDRWKLFDLANDPTETRNLAKQDPEKLEQMRALWWQQARKFGGLPLMRRSPFWIWTRGFSDAFLPKRYRYDY